MEQAAIPLAGEPPEDPAPGGKARNYVSAVTEVASIPWDAPMGPPGKNSGISTRTFR